MTGWARHGGVSLMVLAVLTGCDRQEQPAAPPAPSQGERAEQNQGAEPAQPAPRPPVPAPLTQAGATSISDVAEASMASVVNIASEKRLRMRGPSPMDDPFFRYFFGPRGMPREREERSLGSGVIVSADGVILTNNHVIAQADRIVVTLSDGREVEAEVVGNDPESDVGVVRLKGEYNNLRPMPWGDSSALRLGEVVLAIGNPFGVGQTVTMGIVSAKGRANMGIVDYEDFIQTDAAINPGNSGGALIDLNGKLVGINTAIVSRTGGYQGIGFAIPSNMARRIAESLLASGKVVRGWLGVAIQDVDSDLARALDLPSTQGVLVADVTPGSPAEKAGLQQGDVIVALDNQPIASAAKLRNVVAAAGDKATVTLRVLREGKPQELQVTLTAKPTDPLQPGAPPQPQGETHGLTLAPLNASTQQRFGLPPNARGVVVVGVEPQSPAAQAGFQPGDLIRAVNRRPVTSVSQAEQLLGRGKSTVAVLVQREGHTLYLALRRD